MQQTLTFDDSKTQIKMLKKDNYSNHVYYCCLNSLNPSFRFYNFLDSKRRQC